MFNLSQIVSIQNDIITLQSSAINEMMSLLVRYMDLEEIENSTFYNALDEANQYKKEITL